jgi:hypothetical protein
MIFFLTCVMRVQFCEFAQQVHSLAALADEEQVTVSRCEELLVELCAMQERENSYKVDQLTGGLSPVPASGGPKLGSAARQALSYDLFAE